MRLEVSVLTGADAPFYQLAQLTRQGIDLMPDFRYAVRQEKRRSYG